MVAERVLPNPATGERITILTSAAESEGAVLRIRIEEPDQKGAPRHLHPHQEEHIWIIDGAIRRDLPDHSSDVLAAGGEWVLPPGTPHTWVAEGGTAIIEIEFRPALQSEAFLDELTRIAELGQMNSRGVPNPLRVSLLAPRFGQEIEITSPPRPLQRVLFALLAPIARLVYKE